MQIDIFKSDKTSIRYEQSGGSTTDMIKKAITIILVTCLCAALCGCTAKEKTQTAQPAETPIESQDVQEPMETAPALPNASSDDLKLYAFSQPNGASYLVNELGEYEKQYYWDQEGNIVDADGKILITAENVSNYHPIRTMYFSQNQYTATDEEQNMNPTGEISTPKPYRECKLELYCTPSSATNRVICVRSNSNEVVEIWPESNAQQIDLKNKHLDSREVALEVEDLSQPVKVVVRVLKSMTGEATVRARSLDELASAECTVTILSQQVPAALQGNRAAATASPSPTPAIAPVPNASEFVNASGNPANHVHSYTKSVTEPTRDSTGYTTYTCTRCGYSYQSDFTSKLTPDEPSKPDHIHNYAGITVAPTEDEPGYTLYVCDICGDSYKANYTPAAGN